MHGRNGTMRRMRGHFISRKKGCCFISLAPPFDPKRLPGSLFSKAWINCLPARLTCNAISSNFSLLKPGAVGIETKCRFICWLTVSKMVREKKAYMYEQHKILPECYLGMWGLCLRCWQMSSAYSFLWMECAHRASHRSKHLQLKTK